MRGHNRYRVSARRGRRAWRRGEDEYAVMVLGVDEPPWWIVCAAVGRWAFRHRSAFLPFLLTSSAFLTAAVIHHYHPEWWVPVALGTVVVSLALGIPHAVLRRYRAGRILATVLARVWWVCGIDRAVERAYAALVAALGGGWMAVAIAQGPTTSPLPTIAALGMVIGGVPWWVHRRRRARVRVERTLEAWPDIAESIGLSGARIASVVVDAWGWSARVILRNGKTTTQTIDKIPAIESGFGLRPGSVRVFPDEHRADRCALRVIETDPHAKPILWPGSTVTSITQPLPLGLFEDGRHVRALLLRRNVLIGGMVGSGKSGILNVILAYLITCLDVRVWGIDLKGGMELQPWKACLERLATTPDQAKALLADAVEELDRRAAFLATIGVRVWEPDPASPALIIIIDEYAELPPEAHQHTDSIARRGRAVAVNLLIATQRPTQNAMGHGAVRSQMDIRICLRVRERRDVELILGQGALSSGWHAHILTQPGTFLISAPEHTTPQRARGYLITDQHITRHVNTHTPHHPHEGPQNTPERPERAEHTPKSTSDPSEPQTPEAALWAALHRAGAEGVLIADLMSACGRGRSWVYYRLRDHARAGRVARTTRGAWRAITPGGPADGRPPPRPGTPRPRHRRSHHTPDGDHP
jgi:DNA segregation ATPase FtsK/SpoIIIE, S-DNA-T family